MIDWIKRNKITVAFVGGAIVIGSQWATCSIEPNVVVITVGGNNAIKRSIIQKAR